MEEQKQKYFDWNKAGISFHFDRPVSFDDETLRDGLQSPSVTDPSISQKIELLHLMEKIGIQTADVGLPGAGPRAVADVKALCEEIGKNKMKILPNCAARTVIQDIEPIYQITDQTGVPILACLFLGCSPIRQYTEDWNLDRLFKHTQEAIGYAVKKGLEVMFVTEDTTRANPLTLQKIYTEAIRCGATRVCIADTVGHATPVGTYNLVTFIKELINGLGVDVKIDWHGHSDRGLSIENSLAAYLAGADRIHGTALGIGERCGNTPIELLLTNFKELGAVRDEINLEPLQEYVKKTAQSCCVSIPESHPLFVCGSKNCEI